MGALMIALMQFALLCGWCTRTEVIMQLIRQLGTMMQRVCAWFCDGKLHHVVAPINEP